ncbi:hypothetical protein EYF80_020730 [Liparis tanakae]|uniref:Uncharacterized protein n=1 Tax=Liparis tanakae TaxID=230148 RepID=A0A4Z2HTM0_9TELE|nr:hypothetical protein EYF80_020730 [Liparis tanakae]
MVRLEQIESHGLERPTETGLQTTTTHHSRTHMLSLKSNTGTRSHLPSMAQMPTTIPVPCSHKTEGRLGGGQDRRGSRKRQERYALRRLWRMATLLCVSQCVRRFRKARAVLPVLLVVRRESAAPRGVPRRSAAPGHVNYGGPSKGLLAICKEFES